MIQVFGVEKHHEQEQTTCRSLLFPTVELALLPAPITWDPRVINSTKISISIEYVTAGKGENRKQTLLPVTTNKK